MRRTKGSDNVKSSLTNPNENVTIVTKIKEDETMKKDDEFVIVESDIELKMVRIPSVREKEILSCWKSNGCHYTLTAQKMGLSRFRIYSTVRNLLGVAPKQPKIVYVTKK